VLAVGGVAFGHAVANGQPPHAALGVVSQPLPLILPGAPSPVPSQSAPSRRSTGARRRPAATARRRAHPAALVIADDRGDCYVQVTTARGEVLVRRIIHRGQRVTVHRHGLDVVLGNAGGVRLAIDGHHLHRGGGSGQVRQLRVR
jgi:hypothetical protein